MSNVTASASVAAAAMNSDAVVQTMNPFAGGSPEELLTAEDRGDVIESFDPATLPEDPVFVEEEALAPEIAPVAPVEPVLEEPEPAPVVAEPPVKKAQDFVHRLNKKNQQIEAERARADALEAEIARYRAGTPAPAPVAQAPNALPTELADLSARRQQVMELTIDGKLEEAVALQAQIDTDLYNAAINAATARATAEATQSINQQNQRETIDSVVATLAAEYDFLDAHSDTYDSKTVRMINAVQSEYLDEGHAPAEALRLAADEVLRLSRPHLFTAPTPAASATAQPRRPAVATAVRAAAQQAPLKQGASTRSEVSAPIDIWSLTDEEFSRLTPAQIAQLRGDGV